MLLILELKSIVEVTNEVSCIIDSDKAGLKAQDVLSYGGNIPVVANFDEAQQFEPNTIVIGLSLIHI